MDEAAESMTLEKLNSYERRIVHEICEKFGLKHISVGTDNLKDMSITKIKK